MSQNLTNFRMNITFTELFENNVYKSVFIGISTATSVLLIPLLWNIIELERKNQNKTLLNRILESFSWHILFWNLFVQPWVIFMYVYGPLEVDFICSVDQIFRFEIKAFCHNYFVRPYFKPV